MHDHFFVRLARGSASFVIWALHFTLCYGLAAAQCTPGGMRAGGPDRGLLGVATVVALGACLWLGWRADTTAQLCANMLPLASGPHTSAKYAASSLRLPLPPCCWACFCRASSFMLRSHDACDVSFARWSASYFFVACGFLQASPA